MNRLSPEQRSTLSRIGAHALHATHDSRETTAKARWTFLSRFEREVDPDGTLDPAERAKRAHHALRAHMSKLALARERARAERKAEEGRSKASDPTSSH